MRNNKPCVIGLSERDLLLIEFAIMPDEEFRTGVRRISFGGIKNIADASVLANPEDAKEIIAEIKERYEKIFVSRINIVDACINGNDFNPDDLKVYEIGITGEVR